MKMPTHIHMVHTKRGWHIYKGDEVGVDVDQLSEEMEVKGETPPAPYRKDRVSQSGSDAGHIVIGCWGPASSQS